MKTRPPEPLTATEYARRGGSGVHIDRLFADDRLEFARFGCRTGAPLWTVPNSIGDRAHAVLPHRTVRIHPAGGPPVTADPNLLLRYPAWQVYRREPIDAVGDECLFVAADDELLGDLVGSTSGIEALPIRAHQVLLARTLAGRLAAGSATSSLAVHETLAIALRPDTAPGPLARRASTRRRHRELVADAAALLAGDLRAQLRLEDVAARLHAGQYHLARLFRAETGRSMDGYRMRVRVLTAIERLTEGEHRIADVAADLGFSSHGHLTTACRAVLAAPPSQWRGILARGHVGEARRILEAQASPP